jgi:hypothetical protein
MESKLSLICSQESAIGHYPESTDTVHTITPYFLRSIHYKNLKLSSFSVPPLSHMTSNTPTKSKLYFIMLLLLFSTDVPYKDCWLSKFQISCSFSVVPKNSSSNPCVTHSECLIPSNFLLCSPAQLIKVSCAVLLSSAWYGNIALPQFMLCINRLRASC